jgi:hypothetical protein
LVTPTEVEPAERSVVIERIWSTPSVSTVGGWKILENPIMESGPEPMAAWV